MRGRKQKFTLRFILDVYDAFLRDSHIEKVAEALDIKSHARFFEWIKQNKHLQLAKQLADERRTKSNNLPNYILGNLSPKAKKLWQQIEFHAERDRPETPRAMLKATKALKQEIYLYALINCSYNVSKACLIAGTNRNEVMVWQRDPNFNLLLTEIHEQKKDFFENRLLDLVEMRYPPAVLFVNRTINADRGYSEKLRIEHSGPSIGIDIDSLDLDIETRRKILAAVRKQKEKTNNNGHPPAEVVDVEEVKQLPESFPIEDEGLE